MDGDARSRWLIAWVLSTGLIVSTYSVAAALAVVLRECGPWGLLPPMALGIAVGVLQSSCARTLGAPTRAVGRVGLGCGPLPLIALGAYLVLKEMVHWLSPPPPSHLYLTNCSSAPYASASLLLGTGLFAFLLQGLATTRYPFRWVPSSIATLVAHFVGAVAAASFEDRTLAAIPLTANLSPGIFLAATAMATGIGAIPVGLVTGSVVSAWAVQRTRFREEPEDIAPCPDLG